MLKWLGKMVAEKFVAMVMVLVAIGVIVLVWQYHDRLPSWASVWSFVGGLVLWVVLVGLLPWATYFAVVWIEKAESNVPAAILLSAWAVLDGLAAWWLTGGTGGAGRWFIVGLAFCVGGLYNLIVANLIANRVQGR